MTPDPGRALREALTDEVLDSVLVEAQDYRGPDRDAIRAMIVDAILAALPVEAEPPIGRACLNCGEEHEAGYTTGEVGPFCSACWEKLEARFTEPAVEAEPPTLEQFVKWAEAGKLDMVVTHKGRCYQNVREIPEREFEADKTFIWFSPHDDEHTPAPPTEDR